VLHNLRFLQHCETTCWKEYVNFLYIGSFSSKSKVVGSLQVCFGVFLLTRTQSHQFSSEVWKVLELYFHTPLYTRCLGTPVFSHRLSPLLYENGTNCTLPVRHLQRKWIFKPSCTCLLVIACVCLCSGYKIIYWSKSPPSFTVIELKVYTMRQLISIFIFYWVSKPKLYTCWIFCSSQFFNSHPNISGLRELLFIIFFSLPFDCCNCFMICTNSWFKMLGKLTVAHLVNKVHAFYKNRSLTLGLILSQWNPVHASKYYFFGTHFDIIFYFLLYLLGGVLPSVF
jgi:hypothetical protein